MEMRKRRITKKDEEEEGIRTNHESSSGVYVTSSVEAERILIDQNCKMKEEENIKMINVNALKRAAFMNQLRKSFVKIVKANVNLPN